jgi:2-polyprenyl-3-methyl-5-hydroxy-6-metoxy-1,4-benzoquinol methylase
MNKIDLENDPRFEKNGLGFYEIRNKPSLKELEAYYSKNYYQQGIGGALAYSADELNQIRFKLDMDWYILGKRSISKGSFLDVGCGEGHALSYFREKNFEVKGIDFSDAGIKSKNPHCLDKFVSGDIYKLLNNELEAGGEL